MRKFLIASLAGVAGAALLMPGLLSAAPKQTTGMIASIDAAAGTVTLTTGDTFQLPMSIKPTALNVGGAVRITFDLDPMGLMVAIDVIAIDDQQTKPPPCPRNGSGSRQKKLFQDWAARFWISSQQ